MIPPSRVIVCGGRDYGDFAKGWRLLDHFHTIVSPIIFLAEGGAAGADQMAYQWAKREGIEHQRFEADWKKWGKAAGPMRNSQMLREANPDVVLAFIGGRGTANMMMTAKAGGIPVTMLV